MKDDQSDIDQKDFIELGFFEALSARMPGDDAVLKALGDLYARVGRYEDGLAVDRRLVELHSRDATVWYNLACSLALLNKRAPAMRALRRAVMLGYKDAEWMSRDADLKSIREERGFKTLLRRLTGDGVKKTDG